MIVVFRWVIDNISFFSVLVMKSRGKIYCGKKFNVDGEVVEGNVVRVS